MVEETLIIKVGLEAVETSEEETLEVASEVVVGLEEVVIMAWVIWKQCE